jgi:hypothetical protein
MMEHIRAFSLQEGEAIFMSYQMTVTLTDQEY